MQGQDNLHRLSERAGVEADYWDIYGGHHVTSDETRRTLLLAMGYPCANDAELGRSLARIEDDPRRRLLEPVTVLRVGEGCPDPSASITVPSSDTQADLKWHLEYEDGQTVDGVVKPCDLPVIKQHAINGVDHLRLRLDLPPDLALGYHRLSVQILGHNVTSAVIVAPPSSFQPDWMGPGGHRVWGVACQLYALRSTDNWGVGDFSDLALLCAETAKLGGGAVGLSPLHALFMGRPEQVSPYSPSSRLFLNPLYIDVTQVPEFAASDTVRALMASTDFDARLRSVRAGDRVAYTDVIELKIEAFALLYSDFQSAHPVGCGSDRRGGFDTFVTMGGVRLQRFAMFEALHEHFDGQTFDQWPHAYQDPRSAACADFARSHGERVGFFIFLQWVASEQLAAAAAQCKVGDEGGMDLGLYRDLAVGVARGGADAWIEEGALLNGVNFGAPPDPLAPTGQDWGMAPFHPIRLRDMAYAPYIDMLRANMAHAGAIRIDHAMWMQRMFCIPVGKDGRDGAYIRFPMDDLLAILALESHRNRCLVIGEDLGTVPDGFRERMAAEHILSYRLLHFQRNPDGLFGRPDTYPALSLATPGSHDLPTLAGYWTGKDLQTLVDIGLITDDADLDALQVERSRAREVLIAALVDQGLVAEGFSTAPDLSAVKDLIGAVHRFLARSPAALMMMNLEDIIGETKQVNVPGTVDQHPNWRMRLAIDLKDLCRAGGLATAADLASSERG